MDYEKRRVYYQGFWYTRDAFSKVGSLNVNSVKKRIEWVIEELRLLALIYDEIYVPRSHFLTSYSMAHSDFVSAVVSSNDFIWMIENGIIVSSISPKTDSRGDTYRIFDRVRDTGWLYPALEKEKTRIISDINPLKVDSSAEASNSLDGYRRAARTIEQARGVKGLSDMIAGSSYKNIEFYHELFLKQLRESSIPQEVKEELWRTTNEVYLSNIGYELGGIIVPYDYDVEPSIPRDKYGDMRLYDANTLQIIMNLMIGSKKCIAWIEQDVDKALGFRMDPDGFEYALWKSFQDEYFQLLSEFNKELNNIRKAYHKELPDVNSVINAKMSYPFSSSLGEDVISAFNEATFDVVQDNNPVLSIASKTAVRVLMDKFIRYCLFSFKYQSISIFMRHVINKRAKY